MNVHFQCVIQVCRFNCPDPVCPDNNNNQIERLDTGVHTVGASVNSYAGPSLTTVRSFAVPPPPPSQVGGGQVSQALPPLLQPRPPPLSQQLPPGIASPPQGVNLNRHRGNIGGTRRRQAHPQQGQGNPPRLDPRNPFLLNQQKQHQTR